MGFTGRPGLGRDGMEVRRGWGGDYKGVGWRLEGGGVKVTRGWSRGYKGMG